MYKQVIIILLSLYSISAFSQSVVYQDNKNVGVLNEQTNYLCDDCYYKDTISIFNKVIIIKEPAIVESKNVSNVGYKNFFSSRYYKEITKINKKKYLIKFNNDLDGNSNWLYISLINNKIYVTESLSYSNDVKKIELSKDDFDYIPSTLVCKKKHKIEIKKEFSILDFFELEKSKSNCYHCPRNISVEECLKYEKKKIKW